MSFKEEKVISSASDQQCRYLVVNCTVDEDLSQVIEESLDTLIVVAVVTLQLTLDLCEVYRLCDDFVVIGDLLKQE